MRRTLLLAALVTTTALSWSAVAQSQPQKPAPAPAPASGADALKAEGDALMDDIRYAEALAKYREAYQLSSSPALLYNMGRALEALNRFPEALEMLKSFDAKAPPDLHAKVPNLKKLIDDVENRTAMLAVEAPKGATIKLGDTVLGVAPLAELRVNAGKRVRLEATLEGHEPDVREMDLPGRGKVKVKFNLLTKDKTGILAIDSPVKGATIVVDDMDPRQVPSEVRVLAGKHTVKLTATGYRDNVVDVQVGIGERKPVIIEPGEAPVYERWYFWTIIGLVAAGGAAGAVTAALLIEGPPDEGTIPPCQVQIEAEGDECTGTAAFRPLRVRPAGREPRMVSPGFTFGPVPVLTVRF